MFKNLASRSLVAAIIATTVMIAPLPLSMGSASAATISATSGIYFNGKIEIVTGDRTDSTKPPALSSFDVQVDGISNPVTAFEVSGLTIIYLTLTSTVYSGSLITVSYNAPAVDNTLTNNALQKTNGEDYDRFINLPVTNTGTGGPRPEPNTPGVATVVPGIEKATITVTAPTGGLTPTSYEVTASPGGATCTVTGASGSCIITGLTAGTAYTFTTIAKRNSYSSAVSAPSASVTVLARTAPNTPGVATVVAGGEQATITVTAPTGGLTPTSYVVTATPGGKTCTVTGASGSCIITKLTAGTAYTFTTVAKTSTGSSSASAASASVKVLSKAPSWSKEPLTDSETDMNTVGYMPTSPTGTIIITNEFGFTLDKKNGIKPKIRMKNYAGKINLSISATYKVGKVTKKYKCAFASFGTTKKIKTAKWRWYSPKKACTLPPQLVAAIRANTAKLSTTGTWARQSLTTGRKVRANGSKIKSRTLRYTIKAKPATIK